MKKLLTLFALALTFSMSAQLSSVTESGNTGQRLTGFNAAHYGNIGNKAVDLSFSNSNILPRGATGSYSVAMGFQSTASGMGAYAMGFNTESSGTASHAMGLSTLAQGNYSTALGVSTRASGTASTSMGFSTFASDYGSVVIGQYNSALRTVTTPGGATAFNSDNTAFVIGNGAQGANSDAFKVMFNGDATVGGNLTIASDFRLKKDITYLSSTLCEIKALRPVSYRKKSSLWSEDYGSTEVGFIAQEVQEIYPDMVRNDGSKDSILSVSYIELIPVLVKAIQEQQEIIEEQQRQIQHIRNQLSR